MFPGPRSFADASTNAIKSFMLLPETFTAVTVTGVDKFVAFSVAIFLNVTVTVLSPRLTPETSIPSTKTYCLNVGK